MTDKLHKKIIKVCVICRFTFLLKCVIIYNVRYIKQLNKRGIDYEKV